jgi:hypothetical protein
MVSPGAVCDLLVFDRTRAHEKSKEETWAIVYVPSSSLV